MNQPMNVVRCKGCGELIEIPPVEPKVVVKTEPCRCGMTEGTRQNRHVAAAVTITFVSLMLCIFGSCWASHYYTTEQIKALPEIFEVKKVLPQNKAFPNMPGYTVDPKAQTDPDAPGPQVDPRVPVRPQAPEPPKK